MRCGRRKRRRTKIGRTGRGDGHVGRIAEAQPRNRLDQRAVRRGRQLARAAVVPDQRRQCGGALRHQRHAGARQDFLLHGLASGIGWYGNHANAWLERSGTCSPAWCCSAAPIRSSSNEHVRVDLVYGMVSERARIWIDIIGGLLFLLPICMILDLFHLAVVLELVADRRAVQQCRRPGPLAGQAAPAGRLRPDGAAGHLGNHQARRRARTRDRCRLQIREAAAMNFDPRQHGAPDVRGDDRVHVDRLSGGVLARRDRPVLRLHRHRVRPDPARLSRQPHLSALRHHLQRPAARDPVLHLHGRDPRALRARRGPARTRSASCSGRCAAASPMR